MSDIKTMHHFRIINAQTKDPYLVRLAKVVFSIATICAVFFGPGVLLDSAALQWTAAVVFWILVILALVAFHSSDLTIDEARAKLDEIEKGGE